MRKVSMDPKLMTFSDPKDIVTPDLSKLGQYSGVPALAAVSSTHADQHAMGLCGFKCLFRKPSFNEAVDVEKHFAYGKSYKQSFEDIHEILKADVDKAKVKAAFYKSIVDMSTMSNEEKLVFHSNIDKNVFYHSGDYMQRVLNSAG